MMDIGHFKKCNDTHGHLKGDEWLISLAILVKKRIRSSDFLARYGGEEFALILTGSNRETVLGFLTNLFKDIKSTLVITLSAGVASSDMSENFAKLPDVADQALYESKQRGRNRVSLAQQP